MDGIIVGTPEAVTDGNASFNRTESSTGTYKFSILFYNLTYYFNASTDNSTVSVENPPSSSGGSSSGGIGTSDEPENVEETVVLRIYLQAGESSNYNFNDVVTSAIPVMVVNACKRRFVYLPFRKHFMVLHASTRYITRKIKDERRYNFRQLG